MNFIKVDIFANSSAFDTLIGFLLNFGVNGFEVVDNNDFEQFLLNEDKSWDYIEDSLLELKNAKPRIIIYFEDNETGNKLFINIKNKLLELGENESDFYGDIVIEERIVNENEWANNWKKYFKPFNIGDKLIIKPPWEEAYNPNRRKILEIDPGTSFGTGQHQTTRLCLENLERHIKGNEKVLDIGCGSGILSIASMLLGAKSVTFGDISENAVKSSRENLIKNGFDDEQFVAFLGDITADKQLFNSLGVDYDIICANIVADVLINMSDLFLKLLKNKGILLASGIIIDRVEEVREALSIAGLRENYMEISEDWCVIVAQK